MIRFAFCMVLIVGGVVYADDAPIEHAHRTGRYRLTLSDREPRSSIDELQKRYGWGGLRNARGTYEYKPGDETYEVAVPDGYEKDTAHGLFVWINAGNTGAPPRAWLAELAKRRLIWIGANNSGNARQPVVQRQMLAIDAVHEIKRRYTIDPRRIYVSGVSGGGRMSSQVAMTFPDVFTGAMPIVGVDYFRKIPVPDTKFQYRTFKRPGPAMYRRALQQSRWVLLTGETDYNKPQTQVVHRAMVADRFAHVSYIEVPKMAHTIPDAAWFAKGLALLDEPLAAQTRKALADGEKFEKLGRFGKALEAYESAAHSAGLDDAGREGARKAAELRKLLAESIAVIETKIDAGETAGVLADIQKLKRDWLPRADAAVERLVTKLRGK